MAAGGQPPLAGIAEDETGLTEHYQNVYGPQIQRISRTLRDLVAVPTEEVPEPEGDPEGTIMLMESLIELIEPTVSEIHAVIEEERLLRDEWKKAISKTRGADKIALDDWFANQRALLRIDDYLTALKANRRIHSTSLSTVKLQLKKARRELGQNGNAAPVRNAAVTPSFHLSAVQIPVFSGDITAYQTFWDLFSTMIDQANASDAQKFSYLMTKLSGEPYELIKNLPLTSDNYLAAK